MDDKEKLYTKIIEVDSNTYEELLNVGRIIVKKANSNYCVIYYQDRT
jgi:hypothetical protein